MIRRILVVELLGGLGDAVIVLPAIRALARTHPHARIDVVTTTTGAELLAVAPDVASARPVATDRVRDGVRAALDAVRPDLVVSTTRHSELPALLEREARGARVVADLWRGPPPDRRVGDRFLDLLRADGVVDGGEPAGPFLAPDVAAGACLLPAVGERAPVVLVPAAGMAVKQWPAHRWAGLAAALGRHGHPVVAVGEVPGAARLPPVDLPTLAAVFGAVAGRGGVVVGPDTGPMRVAAAVGATTVALFGPTTAARYGMSDGRGVDLQGFPGCPVRHPTAITEQSCWWEARCPFTVAGPLCLAEIGVGEVAAAVRARSAA